MFKKHEYFSSLLLLPINNFFCSTFISVIFDDFCKISADIPIKSKLKSSQETYLNIFSKLSDISQTFSHKVLKTLCCSLEIEIAFLLIKVLSKISPKLCKTRL